MKPSFYCSVPDVNTTRSSVVQQLLEFVAFGQSILWLIAYRVIIALSFYI